MVSSSKDSRPPPDTPAPEGKLNYTSAAPKYASYLPDDPTQMATGLTASMFDNSSADAAQSPPGAASGGSTAASGSSSSGASAAALASLSPGARQAYEQAMAAGDTVEAARILLSAQMMNQGQQQPSSDQTQHRQFGSSFGGAASGRSGYGGGWSGQGSRTGGVGGLSSGGLY